MANESLRLEEPLLDDQLAVPFFFNGRVLTQEDLSQDRAAQVARRRHLGLAAGAGIAYGLEVEPVPGSTGAGAVTLFVAAGLAIAPDGQALNLQRLVRLRFEVSAEAEPEAEGALAEDFGNCRDIVTVATQSTGLHLLVIRPFVRKEGLAPVSGLGNEAAPCNAKVLASGVEFRAVPFSTAASNTSALFRSQVALECFGFTDQAKFENPFSGVAPLEIAVAAAEGAAPAAGYGVADDLRRRRNLAECEVPLAVVYLDDTGALAFCEQWSVRRSLVKPPLSRRWWPFGGSDGRRLAEAEAGMLQFQDHIAALQRESGLNRGSMAASARFAFLPGGGFLPTGTGNFSPATFLGAGAERVADADFGRLRGLVEESWQCEPFNPADAPELIYFDFIQAIRPWVFFLRRKPELPFVPSAGSPPAGSGASTAGSPKAIGVLLVVLTSGTSSTFGQAPRKVGATASTRKDVMELIDTYDLEITDSEGEPAEIPPKGEFFIAVSDRPRQRGFSAGSGSRISCPLGRIVVVELP